MKRTDSETPLDPETAPFEGEEYEGALRELKIEWAKGKSGCYQGLAFQDGTWEEELDYAGKTNDGRCFVKVPTFFQFKNGMCKLGFI